MDKFFNLQQQFVKNLLKEEGAQPIITPHHGIEVYRNNYFSNLSNALAEAYPLIQKVVGEEFFKAMSYDYIANHPSYHGYVQEYGKEMAQFLNTYPHVASLPYLSELAQFEWACHEIFFSAALVPLEATTLNQFLAQADLETFKFSLHPTAQIFAFNYPILKIWSLCMENPHQEINLDEGGVHVLITRPELEIVFRRLSPTEFNFLNALKKGASLKNAFEQTSIDLAAQFIEWFTLGLLIKNL